MVDIQKALEFVRTSSDNIQQARLDSILENTRPDKDVLDAIERMRKSGGGFAFWDNDVSSITTTLNVLGWLDDLSILNGPIVDRTFDFLLDHQREDGGWDEIEEVGEFDPPPFMMPGEVNTQTWLTACCAHWFIRFGRAEPPGSKGCPAEFLMQHIQPSGLVRGYLYASWDALVMFNYHPGTESEVFKRLLEGVEKRFTPDELDGTDLAWLLRCLRDANLSVDHKLVIGALDALEEKQGLDGSWSSADGPEYSGMATIDAIRVMKDFRRLP
ncbi:MAG: prenyltransferase/squalene oxidase repeat-containing protein [Candidatus Hermodarchaeota archaeon]